MKFRAKRVFAYASGVAVLVLAFYVFQEMRFIGFPDGFVSEYDRLRKGLLILVIAVSALAGVWLFLIGWMSGKRRIGMTLRFTYIIYVFLMLCAVIVDHYLSRCSGRGG
jgi:hypothetical protein